MFALGMCQSCLDFHIPRGGSVRRQVLLPAIPSGSLPPNKLLASLQPCGGGLHKTIPVPIQLGFKLPGLIRNFEEVIHRMRVVGRVGDINSVIQRNRYQCHAFRQRGICTVRRYNHATAGCLRDCHIAPPVSRRHIRVRIAEPHPRKQKFGIGRQEEIHLIYALSDPFICIEPQNRRSVTQTGLRGKNGVAGMMVMPRFTAVELHASGCPCIPQRKIAGADNGIEKEEITFLLFVIQTRKFSSHVRIKNSTQIIVLQNGNADVRIGQFPAVQILHPVRKRRRGVPVADVQAFMFGKAGISVFFRHSVIGTKRRQ